MSWSKHDRFGMISLTAATEIELELDPRYSYKFIHMGVDSAGNDDAASALSAWFSTVSATITADNTVQDKIYQLKDGTNETVGPGISSLYIVSTATADAAIQIVRKMPATTSY